jgi:hypothetical protein
MFGFTKTEHNDDGTLCFYELYQKQKPQGHRILPLWQKRQLGSV